MANVPHLNTGRVWLLFKMSTTYIELDSSDPSVLEHSTPGDFTVQLGRSHIFGEDYEIFLSEAVIPFSWYNVSQENNNLVITSSAGATKTIDLPPAYYESIPSLIKTINGALKAVSLSSITLTANVRTMKVTIAAGTSTVQGPLLRLLGWPKGATVTGKVSAPKMADITGGNSSLYVLIDCVENSTAGSFSIPKLKKIEVGREDRPGDLIHFRAINPVEVHKLGQPTLMHISVTIKNKRNHIVNFNGEPVNLTLGIRRIGS